MPFGNTLASETSGTSSRVFTSYERHSATGLDYAVNRTYDAAQGRFTQVDPIGMSAASLTSPQTLNLYSYCANDPVNHTDPDGLFFGFIGKAFKAIGKAIWNGVKKVLYAAVTAAVSAATAYILSGGNLAAAGAAFIKTFVSSFGVQFAKDALTPGWNPTSAHPLARGSGDAWKYVIKNLTATGTSNQNLTPKQILKTTLGLVRNALKKKDCRDFITQNADPLLDKDPEVTLERFINGTNNHQLINEGQMKPGETM